MIHRYRNNGFNIVLDVNSGSVHVVDDVTYEVIPLFEEGKEKFYNEVVFSDQAPDIEQYKEYYESIDPDNAELLYKQVVEQQQTDSKISDYVKGYSQMKPKEAAAIFDTMTDNLNLVAQILENMDAQSRADILGKMNSDTAAKVTEIMNPSE